MNNKIKILDVTLRDGSYVINFQFSKEDTANISKSLEGTGLSMIEVGHGFGLNASQAGKGAAAATDREYLEAAASVLKNAEFGMFFIPGIGRKEDLELAAKYGMKFVRVGTNVTEIASSEEYIKLAKDLGFFVSYNAMKSYVLTPQMLAEKAKLATDYGADIFALVDSSGGMLPEDVENYMMAIKKVTDIPLGFHGHNNLSLAIANTLKAIECGATIIDASLQGLGRDGGNASTEILVAILKKKGYDLGIDLRKVIDISEKKIRPLLPEKGINLLTLISGYADFHSSNLPRILKYAELFQVDSGDLIVEVCKKDKVNPSEALVEEIAKNLAKK